jgi:hypothetical protein
MFTDVSNKLPAFIFTANESEEARKERQVVTKERQVVTIYQTSLPHI